MTADLLDNMADADASGKACMVQPDAVSVVVQVMFTRFDEQSKYHIRKNIILHQKMQQRTLNCSCCELF